LLVDITNENDRHVASSLAGGSPARFVVSFHVRRWINTSTLRFVPGTGRCVGEKALTHAKTVGNPDGLGERRVSHRRYRLGGFWLGCGIAMLAARPAAGVYSGGFVIYCLGATPAGIVFGISQHP
jgi:hypothetical protein